MPSLKPCKQPNLTSQVCAPGSGWEWVLGQTSLLGYKDASLGLTLGPSPLPGLTTEQMLRKDLKVLSSDELVLAISAIYVDLEVRLSRGGN